MCGCCCWPSRSISPVRKSQNTSVGVDMRNALYCRVNGGICFTYGDQVINLEFINVRGRYSNICCSCSCGTCVSYGCTRNQKFFVHPFKLLLINRRTAKKLPSISSNTVDKRRVCWRNHVNEFIHVDLNANGKII